jgi:hypothetical protein
MEPTNYAIAETRAEEADQNTAVLAYALLAVADELRAIRTAMPLLDNAMHAAGDRIEQRAVGLPVLGRAWLEAMQTPTAAARFAATPWSEKLEWIAREVLAEQIRDGEAYVPWEDRAGSRYKRTETAGVVLNAMTDDDMTHDEVSRVIALRAGVSVDTASEIQDRVRAVIMRLRNSTAELSTAE